jgi:hypothetical protein
LKQGLPMTTASSASQSIAVEVCGSGIFAPGPRIVWAGVFWKKTGALID